VLVINGFLFLCFNVIEKEGVKIMNINSKTNYIFTRS